MSQNKITIPHGLKPLRLRDKYDPRNFKWHKAEKKGLFGAITPVLNADFLVWTPLTTRNQSNNPNQPITNICTAEAVSAAAEAQFGVVIDECFQYAFTKKQEGNVNDGPCDAIQAINIPIKFGALLQVDSPFKSAVNRPLEYADWMKYPQSTEQEAGLRKEFSYFIVRTDFDAIRQALWTSKEKGFPSPVMVGARWRQSWSYKTGGVIDTDNLNEPYGSHFFAIFGQKNINGKLYLAGQPWTGEQYGDKGWFYFSPEVVANFLVAYIYVRGSADDWKANLWSFLQNLYDAVFNLLSAVKK